MVEFLPEDDDDSITRRRSVVSSQIIIGSYRRVLICHDCRNVTAELLRRKTGFDEQCLTLDDLRELVEGATPHSPHQVDFEQATAMAIANAPLREAIEAYEDHRSRAIEVLADVKSTMKLMGWSWSKARDIVGYELAKAHGWELDEGDIHADWLLGEARRGLDLDEAEA